MLDKDGKFVYRVDDFGKKAFVFVFVYELDVNGNKI